ncbi:MAG: hypothetical protein JSV03_13340 [Planctomycetota bacterium]|nr:MAG: hypothetical protein JSV03_13340 [Planctomycetota bacterium]
MRKKFRAGQYKHIKRIKHRPTMHYRRFYPPSKPTIFALLMIGSAILIVLRSDLLQPARNITPLIAFLQHGARETTQKVAKKIEHLSSKQITADLHDKTMLEKQALENENASLRQTIAQLRATQQQLTHIHQTGFPKEGSLIPAKVIAWDAVPSQDSLLLDKGRFKKVKHRDWVASRLLIDAGTNEGIHNQSEVLARESLIGWVEYADLWLSRVVLLSDRQANKAMRVYIVPCSEGQQASTPTEIPYILEGAGQGKMRIRDIPADEVQNNRVQMGDLVTSDPNDPKLPLAMVIGTITELKQKKSDNLKPLFYDAIVEHRYDPKTIGQVFIVDLSKTAEKNLRVENGE